LHRELNVLHVTKVAFQALADINQIRIDVWHETTQRTDRLRIADTSDHVFALSIRQKFPVQIFFSSRWVTRKHHPRSGVLTAVTKDHGLHVHRCAPVLGNPVQLAIGHRPIVMPRGKYRIDAQAQLIPGTIGKGPPGNLLHACLHRGNEFLQRLGTQVTINADAFALFSSRE
jgi:hypothetical protein